jgi:hypothetical protein
MHFATKNDLSQHKKSPVGEKKIISFDFLKFGKDQDGILIHQLTEAGRPRIEIFVSIFQI